MGFCVYCGGKLLDDNAFCVSCGARAVAQPPAPEPVAPVVQAPPVYSQPATAALKGTLIALLVFSIILLTYNSIFAYVFGLVAVLYSVFSSYAILSVVMAVYVIVVIVQLVFNILYVVYSAQSISAAKKGRVNVIAKLPAVLIVSFVLALVMFAISMLFASYAPELIALVIFFNIVLPLNCIGFGYIGRIKNACNSVDK